MGQDPGKGGIPQGQRFMRDITVSAFLASTIMAVSAQAQVPAEVEACRLSAWLR